MELDRIDAALEAILFASGDPVPAERIAKVLDVSTEQVFSAAERLSQRYIDTDAGIRLLVLEDRLQLCSAPEFSREITLVLEQRKPPRLSQSALEVLAIAAYYQPVTRAYIDQVRGVDSSYTVGILVDRGLLEPCGKLEAPGRPTIYKTSDAFLRTMGISSLAELPPLPDMTDDEGIVALQNKIDALQAGELEGQMSIGEIE